MTSLSGSSPIPYFKTINDFLAVAGFAERTTNPYFYTTRLEDTYPHVRPVMPPFRKDFYFLCLVRNEGARSQFSADQHAFGQLPYYMVFQSPGHILSWNRAAGLAGYLVYFKENCFSFFRSGLADEFPFFDLQHTNAFEIPATLFAELQPDFQALHDEQATDSLFKEQIIYAKLLTLLYRCRAAYEAFKQNRLPQSAPHGLTQRYQNLIQHLYLDKRTVEAYADLLATTPNHLNDSVRKATGRTAYSFITEKIMQEAQTLIRYTPSDLAEIAYALNFSGPAHFTRFFKKHAGLTPGDYRRQTGTSIQ